MKNKKESIQQLSLLFQMEICSKVSYSLHTKSKNFEYCIFDRISTDCNTILSDYKSIKLNDIVEITFKIEPALLDKDCDPIAFGWLDRDRAKKKHCFNISVPPSFPERLEFILNRGIKPYFYLRCEKEKHKTAIIKSFSMESDVILEDYMSY